jgi:uncharacterized membrane protein YvlD (DUF360 family)
MLPIVARFAVYHQRHEAALAADSGVPGLVGNRFARGVGLIDGVSMSVSGFIVAVVVFSVAQALLAPLIAKIARRYASAFLGGVGLISTLAALIVATVLTHGITISGIGSWVAATLVVWLVTAVATLLLPILLKPKEIPSKD